MDGLLFISAIVCLGLVVVWYVVNQSAGASGEKGFLGIARDKREIEAPSYREKKRAARPSGDSLPDGEPEQAFTARTGGFREKSAEGYKATGALPRFGERAGNRPPEKPEN